jgi:lysyl-tRNA synthetase class 2
MTQDISEQKMRMSRLNEIKKAGINPFPASCDKKMNVADCKIKNIDEMAQTAGRIVAKREIGKLCFSHIKDASGKMQIALNEKELGKEKYKFFTKNIDVGDFLSIEGIIFVTHAGEKTILVKNFRLLTKTLLPMPEKFHGLTDTEQRYRKRYLDLLSNEESFNTAIIRSKIVKSIRDYFDSKGFFEVETPVLQNLYGGAMAKPFVTHHNALNISLYLRIAPELYLKRLIVGGFEKVYEIAKCFRNEGIDNNHNPEFTQIEFYWAYADYKMAMDLMEDMLPKIIKSAGLGLKFKIGNDEVDFTPPYPKVTMREIIKKYAEIDIEDYRDQKSMLAVAKKLKIDDIDKNTGRGKLVDEIYKKYARTKITNPVFMINHPVELSPLAKKLENDDRYVERFQLLCAGGNELCNAFSELNDPIDQEERFKEQERLEKAGDEESMPYDEDFVTALKHGMPPTAGLGMGIDRLVKLLTDSDNLKEVILFPTLKPEK